MHLSQHLLKQLEANGITEQSPVVVAYSGGVDSHVLLHALWSLREQGQLTQSIQAIHIHHGLSPNADDWLTHCQRVCEQLNISFVGHKVKLAKGKRQSLEAVAREARYQQLYALAPPGSCILLGQHQDDQLETVLLQLKRGAGPKGLAAMAVQSEINLPAPVAKTLQLLRPLLTVSRQQILAYAGQHQLQWIEDESNHNQDFERNFLRHEIVPVLVQKWPQIATTVARSAVLCAEQQALLDEVSADKLRLLQSDDKTLNIAGLAALSEPWRHQVLRLWLQQQGLQSPSLAVLQRLKPELFDARQDANPVIQWGQWQFRRFNGQLYLLAIEPELKPVDILWQGQALLSLPMALGQLHFNRLRAKVPAMSVDNHLLLPANAAISLHSGDFAERFHPMGSSHSKPLKQWFKQWQLPPWQRDKVIKLKCDGQLQALLLNGRWWPARHFSDEPCEGEAVQITWQADHSQPD